MFCLFNKYSGGVGKLLLTPNVRKYVEINCKILYIKSKTTNVGMSQIICAVLFGFYRILFICGFAEEAIRQMIKIEVE